MAADPKPASGWSGISVGWAIASTLLAGVLVVGGLGYLVDRLAGFDHVLLPIGMVIGAVVGGYTVWLQHGGAELDGDDKS
jgi:F0F1-type ATP synthase assembly protein I